MAATPALAASSSCWSCAATGTAIPRIIKLTVASLVEEAVILLPQGVYLVVFQQLADNDEAVSAEGVDLVLSQGAIGVSVAGSSIVRAEDRQDRGLW